MQHPDNNTLIRHLQDVPIFQGLGTDTLTELAWRCRLARIRIRGHRVSGG